MPYDTELQIVANGLGEAIKCHICHKDFGKGDRPSWNQKLQHKRLSFSIQGYGSYDLRGQLLAVWKPTPGNVAMVTDTEITKMSTAVANSPLYSVHHSLGHSTLHKDLSLEVREMIWKEVLGSGQDIKLLTHRLCPHLDAIEICMIQNTWRDSREKTEVPLLQVSKQVQMEALGVLLMNNFITVVDVAPALGALMDLEPGCSQKRKNLPQEIGAAGMEVLMNTFQPFCHRIRGMRIATFFDTDCIDMPLLPKGQIGANGTYAKPCGGLRTEPQTSLMNPNMTGIFSNLRSLTIYIGCLGYNDDRKMPRLLVEEEFVYLFRRLKGFKLTHCEIEFDEWFGETYMQKMMRMLGRKSYRKIDRVCWRRAQGEVTSPALLRKLHRLAFDALTEDNTMEGHEIEYVPVKAKPKPKYYDSSSDDLTDDYDDWYSTDHYPSNSDTPEEEEREEEESEQEESEEICSCDKDDESGSAGEDGHEEVNAGEDAVEKPAAERAHEEAEAHVADEVEAPAVEDEGYTADQE
ncbi:hypothetical protein A1O1_07832 [Capronia coronata CBS 617.96]|uniref:Uncharacterized protein n=1 Tax=Capronia coronata CBS 617.96 TaxID=1182541 RepID=W9XMK0_9EURO|nr:uncharacterized protein A1O1_07832 [Capronia coronata CBS 617.96]EXJ81767.1 hypothetical protein A1O1_07832 [Capronia coronata CBS 617.96]